MNTRHSIASLIASLIAALLLIWHTGAQAETASGTAVCSASSGTLRTSLLELFTSEGCSSCPPADHWLSRLRARPGTERHWAPLSFHVDYWNRLGWADRFSQPAYAARQRWLAKVNRSRTVYTPQFMLNGRDAHPMQAGLPEFTTRHEASAELRLDLGPTTDDRLEVRGEARLHNPRAGVQVFLALYEDNLTSRIDAGENAGSLLKHDYVVRELSGPMPLPSTGKLPFQHAFRLGADWKRKDLGVTAFIQNTITGEVYQALQLPACMD